MTKVKTVRVDLSGEMEKEFNFIKEKFGLVSDSETLRVAIKQTFNSLRPTPIIQQAGDAAGDAILTRMNIEKHRGAFDKLAEDK